MFDGWIGNFYSENIIDKIIIETQKITITNTIISCSNLHKHFVSVYFYESSWWWFTAEVSEQKKKRMKSDSDIARFPPTASMRSQLEHAANLKGEQVHMLDLYW